jgi:hypothetical protein
LDCVDRNFVSGLYPSFSCDKETGVRLDMIDFLKFSLIEELYSKIGVEYLKSILEQLAVNSNFQSALYLTIFYKYRFFLVLDLHDAPIGYEDRCDPFVDLRFLLRNRLK